MLAQVSPTFISLNGELVKREPNLPHYLYGVQEQVPFFSSVN